jgi:uncharacterized phiE125 gp8 family phage protein
MAWANDKFYKRTTLKLKTGPSVFPVTTQQAKLYLGIDESNNDFNSLIIKLLDGAIKRVEEATNRKLITQTWYQYEYDWPMNCDYIELRYNPVQSITAVSYKIYQSGSYTTLSSSIYELDETSEPARLWLNDGQTWPSSALSDIKPIQIEFVCGYGDNEEDIDGDLIVAIMQIVEHWFENRGTVFTGTIVKEIPGSAQDIIEDKRIYFYN